MYFHIHAKFVVLDGKKSKKSTRQYNGNQINQVLKDQKDPVATKSSTPAPVTAIDGNAPAAAASPAPTVVKSPQPVILGPELRKKELIDKVVKRSGIKKRDAKPVIESMLAVLGEALADSRELNLPDLGKVKVRRENSFQTTAS